VNAHTPDSWFKVMAVWTVAFIEYLKGTFEWVNQNSATVMFWIGAIYGVLNIIVLIRREFFRNHKNGPSQ